MSGNLSKTRWNETKSALQVVTPAGRMTGKSVDEADMFCVTDLHTELSAIQGLLLEGISTAVLMLVACAVWDSRNAKNTDSVPIRFGLTVAALALTVGPYTGCSMNPARSLAPALWNNQWSHHWIYWFGPIGGALLSSFTYKTIFGVKRNKQEEPAAEAVALNSVDTQKAEVRAFFAVYLFLTRLLLFLFIYLFVCFNPFLVLRFRNFCARIRKFLVGEILFDRGY